MERNQKIRITSAIVFSVTVVLFVLFFIYLGSRENVTVHSPRHSPYYGRIINITPETVTDPSAPTGKRIVYSWLMDAHCDDGDYLCFFISSHQVDVTIDGELVYSLHPDTADPIARSISSNWCIVPLRADDAGKPFVIQLTPLVGEDLHLNFEILIGSNYNIILKEFRSDLLPMLLSTLCVALGLIIVLTQLYLQIFSGASQWNILFMGIFSIVLGIWRITDIRSAPLLFPANPKVLGYISVGMLLLAIPAMLQFVSTFFHPHLTRRIQTAAGAISLGILIYLILQIFGIIDMEEHRILHHVIFGIGMIVVTIYTMYGKKVSVSSKDQISWRYLPLLAIGITLDLAAFYFLRDSENLIYSCLFFLIFLSISFISSFRETSKMVYRDVRTGLFNKARWNELMHTDANTDGFIGILVLDMNGLKQVNDTLGHEAGDRMILAFADILRNALPSSSVICRWGGDEFAVLLPKTTRQKLSHYTDSIHRVAEEYNQSEPEVRIYFAMGEALSEEHPEMSRMELFRLADETMYKNKQLWYAEKRKREAAQT